jgi:hypothetical protein
MPICAALKRCSAIPEYDLLLLQEELPRGPGTERKESNLRAVNAIAERCRQAHRVCDDDFART